MVNLYLPNSINVPKIIELYTNNGWILWYVNGISIKLFKKILKEKERPYPQTKRYALGIETKLKQIYFEKGQNQVFPGSRWPSSNTITC